MQQLNLYRPELRPKAEWLTASTLAITCVGFVVIMSLVVMAVNNHAKEYEQQVVAIESQKEAMAERIKRIQDQPRVVNSLQLERQIINLKAGIAARESIGQIIQGQNLGNETGFSESLNGLARQSFSSVSLQRIRLSRGGEFVELLGVTRTPQDVPRFLQGLQTENSFKTSQFGLLSVSKKAANAREHEFAYGFDSLYKLVQGGQK